MVISRARARKVNNSVPRPGWKVSALRVPRHISPIGPERLIESRSSACARTSPAAAPNSAASAWMSLDSSASRLGPSSVSTVPERNRCMPCTGRRVIRPLSLSTPIVTTSTSISTARSVVTICRRCSKFAARNIATTALCTRHWPARLPRLVEIKLFCSSSSRTTSRRSRSSMKC